MPGEGTFIVIPPKAGIQERNNWIPTFVGMRYKGVDVSFLHLPVSFLRKQESRKEATGFPLSWE